MRFPTAILLRRPAIDAATPVQGQRVPPQNVLQAQAQCAAGVYYGYWTSWLPNHQYDIGGAQR